MYSSFFNIRYILLIGFLLFLIICSIIPIVLFKGDNIDFSSNNIFSDHFTLSSEFSWPVPGFTRITSQYGNRNKPTAGASSFHYGIDIAATTGSNLVSAISGRVTYTDFNRCKWFYHKNRKQ